MGTHKSFNRAGAWHNRLVPKKEMGSKKDKGGAFPVFLDLGGKSEEHTVRTGRTNVRSHFLQKAYSIKEYANCFIIRYILLVSMDIILNDHEVDNGITFAKCFLQQDRVVRFCGKGDQSPMAARALLQCGLHLNGESVEMWCAYVQMELGFAEGLRRQ